MKATVQSPTIKASRTYSLPKQSQNTDSRVLRVMIFIFLDKCWESKVAMTLQEVRVNTNIPQHRLTDPADESLKKGYPAKERGRPPKASDPTIAADSAKINEATVKKQRGRPRKDSTAKTPPPKRKKKASLPSQAQPETMIAAGDEICDSSPPTPSPPRHRPPPKSPTQLSLSQVTATY